jgi:hypothetical protein
MGRPKGSTNKRSQLLLRKLEDDHKFYVAKELIEIYGMNKKVMVSLMATMSLNMEEGRSPEYGMNEDQLNLYTNTNKELIAILVRLLAYLYPKLKAFEVNQGSSDKVVFNINTMPDVQAEKEQPEQPKEQTMH